MGSLGSDSEALAIDTQRKWEEEPVVYVNGKRRILPNDLANCSLLEYLRGLGLTGTKLGCGEGGCGACTVMVSHFDFVRKSVRHRAINACLAPLYSVEGMHVVTVEGIGNKRHGLHPVQDALSKAHGSQCGFCTPGFVMSMYSLLRGSKDSPAQEEIEESLAGNLCRCTGYRPILDAFRVFAKTDPTPYTEETFKANGFISANARSPKNGRTICPSSGKPCDCSEAVVEGHIHGGSTKESERQNGSTEIMAGEPIFPPELHNRKNLPLSLRGQKGLKWYRPSTLHDLLDLKMRYPDAKLVNGNTEVGIEIRFKNLSYPVLISPIHIPELNQTQIRDDGIKIGASVTLSGLLEVLRKSLKERKPFETSACTAFINQLKFFAGIQIRNVASVGGNICTASPISDLNPLWISAGATFTIVGHTGVARTVKAGDFFLGYRKVDLKSGEILASVFLPWTRKYEYVKEFKQAHRRDDDIALVNAAMRVLIGEKAGVWTIEEVSLVYGGVAAVCVSARKTEEFLKGKLWSRSTLESALASLAEDIKLPDNAPGGMIEFRKSLTTSFFFKFFLHVTYKLEEEALFEHDFPESYRSAAAPYERATPRGLQFYETRGIGTGVGQPLMHLAGELHVTGEAQYADDAPMTADGLHASLVLSTRPHAQILSIDTSKAEKNLGFVGFFCAKDVPGENRVGAVLRDEELFATNLVTCVGQVIGIVVAETHENANAAALEVVVEYEDLPATMSIAEAVAADRYHVSYLEGSRGSGRLLHSGDVDEVFARAECDHIIEGEVQIGGQEHFYMEPNSSLVWTVDGGNEVHMLSSTQAPQKHQKWVASVLDLPMSKVVCKTKRIGGGFGGKESRSTMLAAATAVPAYLLQRAVRTTLDRDIDLMITGKRHSFLGKYKFTDHSGLSCTTAVGTPGTKAMGWLADLGKDLDLVFLVETNKHDAQHLPCIPGLFTMSIRNELTNSKNRGHGGIACIISA